MTLKYPPALNPLIAQLKKLPGVGSRTAERFAFELLSWPKESLQDFGNVLSTLKDLLPQCTTCGCLTDAGHCRFCDLTTRSTNQLCIVASPKDVYTIEETNSFKGLYHVIEHLLSPLDGRYAKMLKTDTILKRIEKHQIDEIIIAFDSTLEGDSTALYIKSQIDHPSRSIYRLAFGLPLGSSLEYIDGATLTKAIRGRQIF